jgi:hypothetical protein
MDFHAGLLPEAVNGLPRQCVLKDFLRYNRVADAIFC